MSNMGYCRFSNTANDLRDCYEHLLDGDLSIAESAARTRLIRLCEKIIDDANFQGWSTYVQQEDA